MNELRDIFAYALPSTVFIFGLACFLLLCAAAVMWPRSGRAERAKRDERATRSSYAPNPSSITRS